MYHVYLTLPFLYASIAFLSAYLPTVLIKTKTSCFLPQCPGCIVLREHKLILHFTHTAYFLRTAKALFQALWHNSVFSALFIV